MEGGFEFDVVWSGLWIRCVVESFGFGVGDEERGSGTI